MVFDERKLKSSYVGVVYIYDLKTKKTLRQGGGYFDVTARTLDVLFDCSEVYEDVDWVPILQTESGFFSPAQSKKGNLIGFGMFSFDHRSRVSMSSFFHWPVEEGLEHITKSFKDVVIDVVGENNKSTAWSKESVELTLKGVNKELDKASTDNTSINVSSFVNSYQAIEQRVRFRITTKSERLSFTDWLSIVHAFRLYWMFRHDRVKCHTANIGFGNSLTLVTDMMELEAYNDNTEIVSKALPVDLPMDSLLLAKTLEFFFEAADKKDRLGVEFAFYRLLGYRFGNTPKRVGDDVLDLVFALDGFCADINKAYVPRLSKTQKESARDSIQKILDSLDEKEIDPVVYDFYNKTVDQVYQVLVQQPYKTRLKNCFDAMKVEYSGYESTISDLDKVRQIFVHGKGYDTEAIVKLLYTRGTTELKNSKEGYQVIFGQSTGLSETSYKMIRELFMGYFEAAKSNKD